VGPIESHDSMVYIEYLRNNPNIIGNWIYGCFNFCQKNIN
jgi:hypothetical protein